MLTTVVSGPKETSARLPTVWSGVGTYTSWATFGPPTLVSSSSLTFLFNATAKFGGWDSTGRQSHGSEGTDGLAEADLDSDRVGRRVGRREDRMVLAGGTESHWMAP